MKRIVLTSFLLLTTIAAALADEITFVANAPKSVVAGKRFSITFEINNKTDGQPSIPDIDGLRILSGPNYSTFTSRQNVNGRVTTRQTITFTYIVIADNEGEIEIPAASISVDGKKYTSNPLSIKVLPQDKTQNTSRQTTSSASSRSSSTDISADDLFVLASLSKTKVYEQEAVLLT
ncbi:MAG: BatD family protein, partial [Bacteroidaceae bacterium]|nr:BatD family protein [Bacteroidaceae bacterium]